MLLTDSPEEVFASIYKYPSTFSVIAPGRINLLGEHTDYNEGFVLPAAVDRAMTFCVAKRADRQVNIYAIDLNETLSQTLDTLNPDANSWARYPVGMLLLMIKDGSQINTGFDMVFNSTIPLGAGMSSSAALSSGVALCLKNLYGLSYSQKQMALLAQQTEHMYAKVKCGIMDMYASIFGQKDHVIKLDCRDLSHEYLPLSQEEISILLVNTEVKHNLAESAYNKRRESCERVAEYFKVKSLRGLPMERLMEAEGQLSKEDFKRAQYVLQEELRMNKAIEVLTQNDLRGFGQLMYDTHEGLSNLYEVSCPELDFLVEQTLDLPQVLGARMMGGGFGGCTINLVKKEDVEEIERILKEKYKLKFDLDPSTYVVSLTDGCRVL